MDDISRSVKFNVVQNLRQQVIQAAITAFVARVGQGQISGRREHFAAKSSLWVLQSTHGMAKVGKDQWSVVENACHRQRGKLR